MQKDLMGKALQLTWKSLSDIWIIVEQWILMQPNWEFLSTKYDHSIEKFFYYLISPAFQKAAYERVFYLPAEERGNLLHAFLHKITIAMVEYQEWNEEKLTSLLETICNTQN